MFEGVLSLASYGFFEGGLVGDMFSQWERIGVFSYLLPFLLIFALIFGILTQIKLFKESKAINGIIALVVALMSLQFDLVPRFFAEIFPRLGIGIAIILVAMILLGMFMPSKMTGIMFGIGAIILVITLLNTAGSLGWTSGFFWADNWPSILLAIMFIVGVVAVFNSVGGKNTNDPNDDIFARLIRSN